MAQSGYILQHLRQTLTMQGRQVFALHCMITMLSFFICKTSVSSWEENTYAAKKGPFQDKCAPSVPTQTLTSSSIPATNPHSHSLIIELDMSYHPITAHGHSYSKTTTKCLNYDHGNISSKDKQKNPTPTPKTPLMYRQERDMIQMVPLIPLQSYNGYN